MCASGWSLQKGILTDLFQQWPVCVVWSLSWYQYEGNRTWNAEFTQIWVGLSSYLRYLSEVWFVRFNNTNDWVYMINKHKLSQDKQVIALLSLFTFIMCLYCFVLINACVCCLAYSSLTPPPRFLIGSGSVHRTGPRRKSLRWTRLHRSTPAQAMFVICLWDVGSRHWDRDNPHSLVYWGSTSLPH